MDEKWQAKLRRLGVVKGARNLKLVSPECQQLTVNSQRSTVNDDASRITHHALDVLLPGIALAEAADSTCYVLDKVYPLSYRHGQDGLAELLDWDVGETAALNQVEVAVPFQDPRLAPLNFRDFVFLDTETTGLAGAGTIAFMVGAAFFEKRAGETCEVSGKPRRSDEYVLVTRQYFLRDHGDEPAMLHLLDELLADKAGLVTFNGRSFDLPLLDARYLMNRMNGRVLDLPHIDLLHPSRRLWRARLGSCALGSLEENLMGLQRSHEDVPGFLIPGLYHDYIRSGDGRDMARVFYHNEIDLLSMVTLAARVVRLLAQPDADDHSIDLYSLGKWQAALGLTAQSEQNLRLATQGDLPLGLYHKALYELGWLLKRNGRRPEAVSLWQQIAAATFDDVTAHVELAKFYEWQAKELETAVHWTKQALQLMGDGLIRDELNHRLNRLSRKLGKSNLT